MAGSAIHCSRRRCMRRRSLRLQLSSVAIGVRSPTFHGVFTSPVHLHADLTLRGIRLFWRLPGFTPLSRAGDGDPPPRVIESVTPPAVFRPEKTHIPSDLVVDQWVSREYCLC